MNADNAGWVLPGDQFILSDIYTRIDLAAVTGGPGTGRDALVDPAR